MQNNIRLFKIFGIEVGLDFSWFLVLILFTYSLAVQLFPQSTSSWLNWTLAFITALLFFASVLAHEFGHSLVAIALGVPVRSITLFIFGGVAQITREPKRALDEFLIAIAGPIASLVMGIAFGLIWLITKLYIPTSPLESMSRWLAVTNLILAVFNMIPGYPLDGGRVFRAIVWGLTGNRDRATGVAAALGKIVAGLFILGGLAELLSGNFTGGIWTGLIGLFLFNAANATTQQVELRRLLSGHRVSEAMNTDLQVVDPYSSVAEVVNQKILPSGRRCFPVIDNGQMLGLVTLHRVKELPQDQWPTTPIRQVMLPTAELQIAAPGDGLYDTLERMITSDLNQLPVMDNGRLVGLIARDNLLNFIKMRTEMRM
ncbi:MAG: site-2 protease family protein [Chloroflexi bacterium]|nr:site-2 protease family protein [Chloroflexota bacterium]